MALAGLRDAVLIAMNSSDHNPAVRPGLEPSDSWELSTPQMLRFHVRGGPLSGGVGGYVLSNANWDPYPLANEVEAFTIALANMGVVLTQRIERFTNPFFTGVRAEDVLSASDLAATPPTAGYLPVDLWAQLTGLMMPVVPQGQPVVSTVEDLQAMTRLKVARGRQAVDVTAHLLAQDLLMSAKWMEVRRVQDPGRAFGPAPMSALAALRGALGARPPGAGVPAGQAVYDFMASHPARAFFPLGPAGPVTQVEVARPAARRR